MENSILVLCGDRRSDALLALLKKRARPALRVTDTSETGPIQTAETVVLPTPVTRGGCLTGDTADTPWEAVFSRFRAAKLVCGGGFSPAQRAALEASGTQVIDFLADERFVRFNALLTAQGALRLLLEETTSLLPGKRVLITGFGRVGKAVARLLHGVGCRCFVAARDPFQRAAAMRLGCETGPIDALDEALPTFDIICNTVPLPLFSAQRLHKCKAGCFYLELASAPFGAEKAACEAAGLRYLDGKGLPGRFLPEAAAEAMLQRMDST